MADGALPKDHLPGANHPPEPVADIAPAQSAYLAHKLNIEGYFEEAKHWLDGHAIETEEQAEKVQTLVRLLQEAEMAADASRVAEKKPLDDQISDIQGRYNPLIAPIKNSKPGLTSLAIKGCNEALSAWLLAQQAIADAAAEAARIEAERLAEEAREAIRAVQETDAPDLTAVQQAQEAVEEAEQSARVAKKAEAFRPAVRGYGRAAALRTYYTPVLADAVKALGWCWQHARPEVEAALLQIAKDRTHSGVCVIPGVTVNEERRV